MRETIRQEGLVDQAKLGSLRVAIHDQHGENEELASEIALIANQLGAPKPTRYVKEDVDWDFLALLGGSEVPEIPPGRSEDFCIVMLLDDGVRITTKQGGLPGNPSSLQKRGLCTIASALFWQEAIRRKGVMLPIEMPKRYVEVSMRFNPKQTPFLDPRDVSVVDRSGMEIDSVDLINREDGTGHWVARVRLEEGEDLADSILDKIRLVPRGPIQEIEHSEVEIRLPVQKGELSGSALVVGVGGLGSWAIHALLGGLASSGSDGEGIQLFLIDPDLRVERHNLNRQVLYTEEDIGNPKVNSAAEKISRSLPGSTIVPFLDKLGMAHLEVLGKQPDPDSRTTSLEAEEVDSLDSLATNLSITNPLNDSLEDIFSSSDVALACVDNLRDRSLLGALAAKSGIPMVNAGAQGFNGQLDVFLPDDSCMLCRHGMNAVKREVRMSCQEDGEVPFSTIVTSTAIFGALQGLAMMAAMSDGGELDSWPSQIRWSGKTNSVSKINDPKFGPFAHSFSSQGNHSEHLEANLLQLGGDGDGR